MLGGRRAGVGAGVARPAGGGVARRRARGGGAADSWRGWQRSARLSLLAAVALAVAGAPAWGFVRKKTDGGLAEYWQPSCIPLDVYINDFAGMSRDEVAKSISAAAHTWSPTAVTCPDGFSHPFFEIVPSLAPANAPAPRPSYDGHNTLLFYTAGAPYPENSALGGSTIALTSVWARADGHIVDADVQVNALDNTFANLDPGYVVGRRHATRSICRTRSPTSSGTCWASATPAGISSATSISRSTTWTRASRCATRRPTSSRRR